jgi:hypothetical protein
MSLVRRLLPIWGAAILPIFACQLPAFYSASTVAEIGETADLPSGPMVVAPVTVPDDLEMGERIAASVDSFVANGLTKLGYDVVPPGEYAAIWDSLTRIHGGFFDPFTGVRHEASYDSAVAALFTQLRTRFKPGSFVYPGLFVADAEIVDGYATWDGYREYFDLRVGNGVEVLGISLVVTVEDADGAEIHSGATGVRVIERYSSSTGELIMVDPLDSRLSDQALSNATGRLLKPFAKTDTLVTKTPSRW